MQHEITKVVDTHGHLLSSKIVANQTLIRFSKSHGRKLVKLTQHSDSFRFLGNLVL